MIMKISSHQRRDTNGRLRVNPDDVKREEIRQAIYDMYNSKENVTLVRLLVIIIIVTLNLFLL